MTKKKKKQKNTVSSCHTQVTDKILIKWKATSLVGRHWEGMGGNRTRYHSKFMTIPLKLKAESFFECKAAAHWMLEKDSEVSLSQNYLLSSLRSDPPIKTQWPDQRWGQNKSPEKNAVLQICAGLQWVCCIISLKDRRVAGKRSAMS